MNQICRLNDTSDHGGYLVSATSGMYSSDLEVAVEGDLHWCPIKNHGTTPVTSIQSVTYCNGVPVLTVGCVAGCGAILIAGDPSVY